MPSYVAFNQGLQVHGTRHSINTRSIDNRYYQYSIIDNPFTYFDNPIIAVVVFRAFAGLSQIPN